MADATITASSVIPDDAATIEYGTGGAAITHGQVCYKDTQDDKWKLAQHDGTAEEAGTSGLGVAVSECLADGQQVAVVTAGNIAMSTLAAGVTYCASANAGGMAPDSDVGTGDYKSVVGVATTTANLLVKPIVSGAQIA